MRRYRLFVQREQYKVSCAHMTVFPDGSKERLHGHNYQLGVVVEVSDISFEKIFPFAALKQAVADLCSVWKEKVFLAKQNPYFKQNPSTPDVVDFVLCGDHYVMPAKDVIMLDYDNITVETLADSLATHMQTKLGAWLRQDHVHLLEATVSEIPGQGATCMLRLQ